MRTRFFRKQTKHTGMSMIEVVVAMGVLILIGGALVTLVLQAVALSNSAKMRSIASRYAEEGMEVVRSIRGPQVDWTGFVNSCTSSSYGFYITSGTQFNCEAGGILAACPTVDCAPGLLQDNVGYAKFYRIITIQPVGLSGDKVTVTVKATWNDQGKPREVTLVSLLTKWQ